PFPVGRQRQAVGDFVDGRGQQHLVQRLVVGRQQVRRLPPQERTALADLVVQEGQHHESPSSWWFLTRGTFGTLPAGHAALGRDQPVCSKLSPSPPCRSPACTTTARPA